MTDRRPTQLGLLLSLVFSLFLLNWSSGAAQQTDTGNYVIGASDVLNITVWGQDDVSGLYSVERDGTFTFPLIGRVNAKGLTLLEFEGELQRLLGDGFFRNPQVTVSVAEYRSQRIFVVGEVRQPGTYPLTGNMRLMDALTGAGSTTPNAANELLIVRAADAQAPQLPGTDDAAEVITVDLGSLHAGGLLRNLFLRDGDTVYVPRVALVFVTGQVRSPGSYALTTKDTTVLQSLALAGGATPFGAVNRITILRRVEDEEIELKVELQDLVKPGDTIVVPERFF